MLRKKYIINQEDNERQTLVDITYLTCCAYSRKVGIMMRWYAERRWKIPKLESD